MAEGRFSTLVTLGELASLEERRMAGDGTDSVLLTEREQELLNALRDLEIDTLAGMETLVLTGILDGHIGGLTSLQCNRCRAATRADGGGVSSCQVTNAVKRYRLEK